MKPRPAKKYAAVIDATDLFESDEIKDFDFGEVDIEEVQICEMGVKEVDGENRYKSVGGFSLIPMDEQKADAWWSERRMTQGIGEWSDRITIWWA